MSILSTIKHIGLVPTLYKLKHLYLCPDSYVLNQVSQNGAYEYLQRYRYAVVPIKIEDSLPKIKDNPYVWVCWLQGLDEAPLIVQRCVESIRKYCPNREVVFISEKNIHQYISIPTYIVKKHQEGTIPNAHYSDIIRLLLLQKYGGIWMDSTIMMTGTLPEYIEDSTFFVYHAVEESGHVCAANGFIAACAHHPYIENMVNLLLEYWKNENRLISYSIFHIFFYMLTHAINEDYKLFWQNTPLFYYAECEKYCMYLDKEFDATTWERLKQYSNIHKLSYKYVENHVNTEEKDTFYDILIKRNTALC